MQTPSALDIAWHNSSVAKRNNAPNRLTEDLTLSGAKPLYLVQTQNYVQPPNGSHVSPDAMFS